MKVTLKEIAEKINGEIIGDADTILTGVATIENAGQGDLTFLTSPKYAKFIDTTKAAAIICSPETIASDKTLLALEKTVKDLENELSQLKG